MSLEPGSAASLLANSLESGRIHSALRGLQTFDQLQAALAAVQ